MKEILGHCTYTLYFIQMHRWYSNLVTLIGENLTSHVIRLTPILAQILTSCSYNCWPLFLRMSVLESPFCVKIDTYLS